MCEYAIRPTEDAPSKKSKLPLSTEDILGMKNACDAENSEVALTKLDVFFNLLDQALAAIELERENTELRAVISARNARELALIHEIAELKRRQK